MKKVVRETVLLCSYDKVPKARRDNARGHISRVYTVYTEKNIDQGNSELQTISYY